MVKADFLEKNKITLYIVIAYIFSVAIHLVWLFKFGDNPNYYFNGAPIINTNDGYYFASGVQKELFGLHQENPLVPSIYSRGLVFVSYLLAKVLPFSLDTIIFYMPAIISSLVVIPLILIGKLYNNSFWGFLSALLGSIAWSYYNRTLVGYYDTDMFALTFPVFILYFLLKSIKEESFQAILFASLFITLYEFFYLPGKTVAYALGIVYALYLAYLYIFKKQNMLYFLIPLFIALSNFYLDIFPQTMLKILLLVAVYFYLKKTQLSQKVVLYSIGALALYFLISSEALLLILHKVSTYTSTGTKKEGLHFFGVFQTISEASGIPMFPTGHGGSNVAYRIMGSSLGFILFIAGYILLVIRNKEFIIALPLVGIGIFAHWGGLRFTVYAVPIAALSSLYLLFIISEYIKNRFAKVLFLLLATAALLYPNINHTLHYNPGVVFTKPEIKDLKKLDAISNPKDYTLTWWDYGYPIWYYSDTNTLLDGAKHHEDNFIISKMFLSTSPTLAANLAKISVETYAKNAQAYQKWKENGEKEEEIPQEFKMLDDDKKAYFPSPSHPIINTILQNKQKNQKDPNEFLATLESNNIKLPPKTRNIYWYAPSKMSRIFLTVSQFSNLDLNTGNKLRNIWFYPTYARAKKGSLLLFSNGVAFDYKKGELLINNSKVPVKLFITTKTLPNGDIKIMPQRYRHSADKIVLFIENNRRFILLDNETFKSNYVQMFLLGNYDKNLFELVVKSPYSRVYKIK